MGHRIALTTPMTIIPQPIVRSQELSPTRMQVSLQTPLRRLLFAGAVFGVIAVYLLLAARTFRAHRLAEKGQLESAIKLAPGNAEYYRRLGLLQLFTETNPRRSIESLTASVALNPFSARGWLGLASAYQLSGDSEKQRQAIQRAVDADPTTPQVAWEAAVFFGARGDVDAALRYLKVVGQYDDPSLALETAWKLTHDADKIILASIPDTTSAHIAFLRLMVANYESVGAEKTWNHLIHMGQVLEPKAAMFYIQSLLDHNDGPRARNAWRDLTKADPALMKYTTPPNLVTNPSFEEEMLNGGLDWQFKPTPSVSLSIDTSVFHAGAHSLAISFGGEANSDAGVSQFIPVSPNSRYELTGYTKGDQISSANGPYLAVSESQHLTQLAKTEEFAGSYPWRPVSLGFLTGPNTSIVVLSLKRDPGSTRIRGQLWLDELSLVQK